MCVVSGNVQLGGISPRENTAASGLWHSIRKAVLLAFSLVLVSGISGTLYLTLADHPGYGIGAFLQGPQSLIPAPGFQGALVEFLIFVALSSAAAGLFILGMINSLGRSSFKHTRAFRISLNLLAVSYAETLFFLAASAVLGIYNTQNSPALAFGTGNTLESALFIFALILLISFVLFVAAGLFFGVTGTMANAVASTGRYEFALIAPFLLGGIFYYPLFIVAGVLGISTALTERSFVKVFAHSLYGILNRAAETFLSSRRLEIISALVSSVTLILLFLISTITVPFYAHGTLVNYSSKYLSGILLLPMILGIVASSAVLVLSLFSIFRTRLKFMTAATLAAVILTASPYLYFSITMLNSTNFAQNFAQFSKFQSTYVAVPYLVGGIFLGMILPILYSANEARIKALPS